MIWASGFGGGGMDSGGLEWKGITN